MQIKVWLLKPSTHQINTFAVPVNDKLSSTQTNCILFGQLAFFGVQTPKKNPVKFENINSTHVYKKTISKCNETNQQKKNEKMRISTEQVAAKNTCPLSSRYFILL